MPIAQRSLQVLKGPDFAARLEDIFRESPAPSGALSGSAYQRILLPGLWGGELIFARMGFIGQALRLRGAQVTALLCDALLPACAARKVDHHDSACTRWCHKNAGPFARAMRLPHRWYSEFISESQRRDCKRLAGRVGPRDIADLEFRGVHVGPHILRTLESHFRVGAFDPQDPQMAGRAAEFVEAALYLTIIAQSAVQELNIDKVVVLDGFKNTWGIFRAVAGRAGVAVDVLRAGLRGYSYRFECDRSCGPAGAMPQWHSWRELPLTAAQNRALDDYMTQRATTPYSYLDARFQAHTTSLESIRRALQLPDRPRGVVFGMFPNVSFDVGKTSTAAVFPTANDWVLETLDFFAQRPAHEVVVKIHPSEHLRAARDPLMPQIRARFDPLPSNIHVLSGDTDFSAHSVVRLLDCALVFTSTLAVEAAVLGVPVILAGGGWNGARGFTLDVRCPQEYFRRLSEICESGRCPEPDVELARRFAYAQFFRINLPIRSHSVMGLDVTEIHVRSASDLAPGGDEVMDVICEGILANRELRLQDPLESEVCVSFVHGYHDGTEPPRRAAAPALWEVGPRGERVYSYVFPFSGEEFRRLPYPIVGSPPGALDGPGTRPRFGFSGVVRCDGSLFAGSWNGIYRLDRRTKEVQCFLTNPYTCYIHRFHVDARRIVFAMPFKDLVVIMDHDGRIEDLFGIDRSLNVVREARDPAVDWRLVSKPWSGSTGFFHFNHVQLLDGQIYLTSRHLGAFVVVDEQRRKCSLRTLNSRTTTCLHDGDFFAGRFYFTSIDGKLLVASEPPVHDARLFNYDLQVEHQRLGPGERNWCRGVAVGARRIYVTVDGRYDSDLAFALVVLDSRGEILEQRRFEWARVGHVRQLRYVTGFDIAFNG